MDCVILYVVCQCQLSKKNELFMIAHQLVDLYPEKSIPWFAVGTYYFSIGKYMEARNYYR